MRQLAAGVWQLKGLPAERHQRLPGRGRADRRRHPPGGQAHPAPARGARGERARAHPRAPRSPGRVGRGLRAARHPLLGRRASTSPLAEDPDKMQASPGAAPAQPADHEVLVRTRPPRRPPPARGRRGGRLPGDRRARPLARARRLLARVRPRADPRRRAQQHGRGHRHPGPARPEALLHRRPGGEPPLGPQARAARAQARPVRPRRAAARHAQVRRLRERACPV